MSKEKQIEEMDTYLNAWFGGFYNDGRLSNYLYSLGYRKQSEGEWTYGVNDTVKCSICRRRMPKIYCMNYCPNCGARMSGGKNE